jgi:hypothetical protein
MDGAKNCGKMVSAKERLGKRRHRTNGVGRKGRRKDAKRKYVPASSHVLQIIRDAMIPRMQQNALRSPNSWALSRKNAPPARPPHGRRG